MNSKYSVLFKSFLAVLTASSLLNNDYDQKAIGCLQCTCAVSVHTTESCVYGWKHPWSEVCGWVILHRQNLPSICGNFAWLRLTGLSFETETKNSFNLPLPWPSSPGEASCVRRGSKCTPDFSPILPLGKAEAYLEAIRKNIEWLKKHNKQGNKEGMKWKALTLGWAPYT